MNDLVPLHFETADVRMVMRDGEPWWAAADIVPILKYHSAQTMVRSLDADEKGYAELHTPSAKGDGRGGGLQKMLIISLSGLLTCTLRSTASEARRFRRWVTGEVLPSLMRHGQYPPPKAVETVELPDLEPIQAPEGSTAVQRFLEEADRMAVVMDTTPAKLLGVLTSAQTLRMMHLHGEGLDSILKKADKVRRMASVGFDMPYILRGERTMTREERDLVAQLREVDSRQRAAAFGRFTAQLPALAAPSADGIEED